MKKNEIIIIIAVVLILLGLLAWKKMGINSETIALIRSTDTPSAVSLQTTTTLQLPAGLPVTESTKEEAAKVAIPNGFVKFQDPFCQSEARGFITLPSLFLKEFYFRKDSWIALPESFAMCFKDQKTAQFVFFEYHRVYQMPWLPLVKMNGQIRKVQTFSNIAALEKNVETKNYHLKPEAKARGIFDMLHSLFLEEVNKPWVLIQIANQDIEQEPAYWPRLPLVHAVAKFITGKELNLLYPRGTETALFIDVRSKEDKEKFKIPFKSVPFRAKEHGRHRSIIEPAEFHPKPNKELFGLNPNQDLIVVGNNEYDQNIYNAANFLALAGYKKILILRNGIEDLGAPDQPKGLLTDPLIDADSLRKMKGQDRRLVLVDCRNPGFSNSTINGSLKISFKGPKEKEEIDVTALAKEIQAKSPSQVILFGSNGLDPKPNRVKKMFANEGWKIQTLRNGFASWQFASKYRWLVSETKKKTRGGSHPPPERKKMATRLNPIIKVNKENQGKPTGSVPPRKIKEEDLKKIKSGGNIIQ